MFSEVQSMLTWSFSQPHCSALLLHDSINPAMLWFRNLSHGIWLLLLAASWCSATSHLSQSSNPSQFITCLDLLWMWSFSSALVSRSSDHLLSCCGFFCSMTISRSLKYPKSPWSRYSLLHPKLAQGFHSLPHCASQLILISALPSCTYPTNYLTAPPSFYTFLPELRQQPPALICASQLTCP